MGYLDNNLVENHKVYADPDLKIHTCNVPIIWFWEGGLFIVTINYLSVNLLHSGVLA